MIKRVRYYRNLSKNKLYNCNDEQLHLLCKIRHEFTNYDKLSYFYEIYTDKRKELNQEITRLIKNGADYIPVFRENVKLIEDYVDLNNKDTRKRFIEAEKVRLGDINPQLTNKEKFAIYNLNRIIRANNKNNKRNNLIKRKFKCKEEQHI